MNHQRLSRTRRRTAVACVLLTLGIATTGSTFASLSSTITDGPDRHSISTTKVIDFAHAFTAESDTIFANISFGEPSQHFSLKAQNVGAIDSQFAFYLDRSELEAAGFDFTHEALGVTTVRLTVPTAAGEATFEGSLSNLLNHAIVTDKVVKPDEVISVGLEVIPWSFPTGGSDPGAWKPGVLEELSGTFKARFLFNQLTNVVAGVPTSNLLEHAKANGFALESGTGAYILPLASLPAEDAI